jgi:hypothetical protein
MAKEPFTAKLTSVWIGGLFYWALKGFSGKFTNQLTDQYKNRNFWTGYILSILMLSFLVYLVFLRY